MLLIGRELKDYKIKSSPLNFAKNCSFTKFLIAPIRDTSIFAAQRAKSQTNNRVKEKLDKKLKSLAVFKDKLTEDKQKFAEYEKYSNFFSKVNRIINQRSAKENKSATLIQSTFRGFILRKVYLKRLIDIHREVLKKHVGDLENYSTELFNNAMGHKAATIIQKHFRRHKAQIYLKNSLMLIKKKAIRDEESIVSIQTCFRQFLAAKKVNDIKFELYRDHRLAELFKMQKLRLVKNFMKKSLEKIYTQREEKRKSLETSTRRKGIMHNSKLKKYQKDTMIGRLSSCLEDVYEDCIPNVYLIFRPIANKNRPLTSAEKSQQQTESSCARRREIIIKRKTPIMAESHKTNLPKPEDPETFRNPKKYEHIESQLYRNTESSWNRIQNRDGNITPDFMKLNYKGKVSWDFLKPTITSESHRNQYIAPYAEPTISSTRPSRSTTPNKQSRCRTTISRSRTAASKNYPCLFID